MRFPFVSVGLALALALCAVVEGQVSDVNSLLSLFVPLHPYV